MDVRAERTLTSNSEIFRDALNASPFSIVLENLEGQPPFANPALCTMPGFSEDELRRKHCVQFSPPDDAEKDWVLFQKLRAGSIGHYPSFACWAVAVRAQERCASH